MFTFHAQILTKFTYVPIELLAAVNHSMPLIHESRFSFSCFSLSRKFSSSLRVTHKPFAPSLQCELIASKLSFVHKIFTFISNEVERFSSLHPSSTDI